MAEYFADTYALVEILKGNPNYGKYSSAELYTTEFNLLELSYALVRDFGMEKAEEILEIVKSSVTVVVPRFTTTFSPLKYESRRGRTGKSCLS